MKYKDQISDVNVMQGKRTGTQELVGILSSCISYLYELRH